MVLVEVPGELDLALQDLLVDGHGVLIRKGVNAGVHLVDEDSERPPVNRLSMSYESQ